ncbi:hypothetical protein [uncultured Mycolicibacterium sp.]|uniref:hypothetical protein n=1 Tax=uncultured Mycolicibacterium sp. TaxID=2320817 RepID=UPI0032B29F98
MALMWWPVAILGALCLLGTVALAVLIPTRRSPGDGLALANTSRLSRLPEYRAVLAARTRSTAIMLAVLLALFGATVVASARPSTNQDTDSREDIMLCVAEPATSEATGRFLSYFARQAGSYSVTRIGLTSPNRRVVPLTRDYQFAAERFGDYAQISQNPSAPPPAQPLTAPVEYTDYAPTVADVLALCLNGFPGFPAASETDRSVLYLGPGELRATGDDRPSLFTDVQVADMARDAGVRIDALATAGRPTNALAAAAERTGGLFLRYDPAAATGQLDQIRAAQQARGADEQRIDAPVVVLIAALMLTALLGISLLAVRR